MTRSCGSPSGCNTHRLVSPSASCSSTIRIARCSLRFRRRAAVDAFAGDDPGDVRAVRRSGSCRSRAADRSRPGPMRAAPSRAPACKSARENGSGCPPVRPPARCAGSRKLRRRAGLQCAAGVEDHHAIGEPPRFAQVVRHQDDRRGHALAQCRQLPIERLPGGRIDGGKRLVEQQHLWVRGASARARATRCCWPPDSWAGRRCPGRSGPAARTRSERTLAAWPRRPAMATLSNALKCGNKA